MSKLRIYAKPDVYYIFGARQVSKRTWVIEQNGRIVYSAPHWYLAANFARRHLNKGVV